MTGRDRAARPATREVRQGETGRIEGLRVTFADPFATDAYTGETLRTRALGGTEGSCVRVAEALADRGAAVTVAQPARTAAETVRGVRYVPLDARRMGLLPRCDAFVLLRAYKLLGRARRAFPRAQMLLWLHCFAGRHRARRMGRTIRAACTTVVAVSDCHARSLRSAPLLADDVCRIYNPLDPSLAPDGTPVDPHRLVFLSSPHKGLGQVLGAFARLRERMPDLRLSVANPGYLELPPIAAGGVDVLGALPHADALRHVRGALCLFYPQDRFAETFGLVFAEAHAVGTPVLACPVGSAVEVVGDPDQLVGADDVDGMERRLRAWQQGARPACRLRPAFEADAVASAWAGLLGSGPRALRRPLDRATAA